MQWLAARGTTVVESSSGSTAISEAYFARLLGLPFLAVMPANTSPLADTRLYHHHIRDDDTWLVTRIAATPLTVVGDVLLFAIFWPILLL